MKHSHDHLDIIKADGSSEQFSTRKLMRSLRKAGATTDQAQQIFENLQATISEGMSSKQLERYAFKQLKQLRHGLAARYQLKRAIMELGPSGYPFESLITELFRFKGYQVQTGKVLQGRCVEHEVDVIAQTEDQLILVECKYRNIPGFKCDVKVPLYIHSRFEDLRLKQLKSGQRFEGWIATNARFSGDAMKYGECVGLKLLSWDYPQHNSLRHWIDNSHLYPLTILTQLTKTQKQTLLAEGLILCQDLVDKPKMLKHIGLDAHLRINILEECELLSKGL